MNASDASRPTARRWKAIALLIIGLGVLMVALRFGADLIERKLHEPPSRSTLSISTQELLDRYNKAMVEINRELLLPPVNALEDGGRNAKFHVLRHAVRPTVFVSTEVENTTSKPFSLSVYAAPRDLHEGVSMAAAQTAIGIAFFGKGENGGALVRMCANAAKNSGKPYSEQIETFEVFCSTAEGLWMAGVSVPNNRNKLH